MSYEFDELKIDKFFIENLDQDEKFEQALKTIIAVGRSMNMKILAEGVETQEQFDKCKKLGVDLFQGFYLSRPKNLFAVKQLMENKDFQHPLAA